MIKKIVTVKGETVGLVKVVEYKGKQIVRGLKGYSPLTKEEKKEVLKRINIQILNAMNEIDEKEKKEKHKESLRKFLNSISKKEYLDFEQMRKAISLNPNLTYMYDLISGLSDFKATKKGIKCIDSVGNTIYFYPKDKYYFYKSSFLGMY